MTFEKRLMASLHTLALALLLSAHARLALSRFRRSSEGAIYES